MAKVNDLQCVGDALFQGDVKVNGYTNKSKNITDGNCLIINYCKILDLSSENNYVQIDLPDGYVCNSTAPNSYGSIGYNCYDNNNDTWTQDAYIIASCVNAQDDSVYQNGWSVSHNDAGTRGLISFAKSYIKVEVQTKAIGTAPSMMVYGTIYCKKI